MDWEVRPVEELRDFFLGSEARQYRRVFSRLGWALTLMLALSLGGQVLLQLLLLGLVPKLLSQTDMLYLISSLCTYCIGLPVGLLVLRTLPAVPRAEPPRPLSAGQAIQLWLVCVGSSFLLNMLTQWFLDWMGQVRGIPLTNPVVQMSAMSPWLGVLLSCGLAPVAEELCFRRFLLDRLRPWGDGFALCASALLFALFHGNLFQSLYTLAIGFLLGGITLYTGQLRWAVLFHAAFNFLSTGLAPLATYLGPPGEMAYSLLVILSMAWTLHWLVDQGGRISQAARSLRWGDGEAWGHFLVNPGMTVFLLGVLTLTWWNGF